MKQIVDHEVRGLYLEYIRESVPPYGRSRYRNPQMYAKVEPRESILRFDDVDKAKVWVWSDQHFWHKNIISYCDRPYGSLEHMHIEMLKNYKMCVGDDDICIWVGDIAFCRDEVANEILSEYPGYKILVCGNHDFNKKKLRNLNVDEIHLSLTIQAAEDLFLAFTHFPLENRLPHKFFTNMGIDVWNIHGHIHNARTIADPRLFNVCVEVIDYTPSRLDAIVLAMEARMRHED